jgi:hypothetical protein
MSTISSPIKDPPGQERPNYELLSQAVNNFSFFDGFNLDKRKELVNLCIETLELAKKNTATDPSITPQIQELTKRAINKARGGMLSNFFLSIVSSDYKLFTDLLKNLDKLLSIKAPAAIIASINSEANNRTSQPLLPHSKLLFSEHIYEKMVYYGHRLEDKDGVPVFKFTKRVPLHRTYELGYHEIHEESFKKKVSSFFSLKDLVIEFEGDGSNGRFERIEIKNLGSEDELFEILTNHPESQIIYPTKNLTVDELQSEGILDVNYCVSDDFEYLDEGFVPRSSLNWTTLRPINHIQDPPEQHQLEIVVYSRQDMPGIFSDQGHASIKLTTPSGEVYEVGLSLAPDKKMKYFEIQPAVLCSPDQYTYLPKRSFVQNTLSYTLTPDAFKAVIKKIEGLQEARKFPGLAYHPFLNNCAAFARDIRNTALDNGAVNNSLAKKKFTTIDSARTNTCEQVAKSIFNFAQTFQNINPENHNFTYLNQEGFYLPLQLLFDRTVNQIGS